VTYRIYNEFGCIKEEIIDLKIGEGYEIIVPSAFTPNNDNINDYFRPVFSGFVDIYIAVYDQQGNMVYTMQDEVSNLDDNWGWNGLINNTGAPLSGPYRYIINATSIDGEIVNRIGEVFLIN
jgi:gliding motility-associated-like protein